MRNPVAWIITVFGLLAYFTPAWRIYLFVITIGLVSGYILLSIRLCCRARSAVTRIDPDVNTACFFPGRALPDRWLFVQSKPNGTITAYLADSMTKSVLRKWQFPPPLLSPFVANAARRILQDLEETIRFSYPEVRYQDGITFVNFRDLSFLYSEPMELGSIKVQIDGQGKIISEKYQEVW